MGHVNVYNVHVTAMGVQRVGVYQGGVNTCTICNNHNSQLFQLHKLLEPLQHHIQVLGPVQTGGDTVLAVQYKNHTPSAAAHIIQLMCKVYDLIPPLLTTSRT